MTVKVTTKMTLFTPAVIGHVDDGMIAFAHRKTEVESTRVRAIPQPGLPKPSIDEVIQPVNATKS